MGSERSTRNILAAGVVFAALLLLPALFAGCGQLPSEITYECLTDAQADSVAVTDTVIATCTKQ